MPNAKPPTEENKGCSMEKSKLKPCCACPETKQVVMAPVADRNAMEAHLLQQEIVRIDTILKQRIVSISSSVRNEKSLMDETKKAKELVGQLTSKIEYLNALTPRLASKASQVEVRSNVENHTRELQENSKQLRQSTLQARTRIVEESRNALLRGGTEGAELRQRENNQKQLKDNAAKNTERLSDLVSKMGERLTHSENVSEMKKDMEVKEPKLADLQQELSNHLRLNQAEQAKRLLTRCTELLLARDDSMRSTVHYAAVGGCLPILQFVVGQKPEEADAPDELGWTPLMIASSAGRTDVVRYLLSLPQVSVTTANKNGQTALHYAVSKNHREIAKILLDSGANVNAADRLGATPLHRAASQGHEQMVALLLTVKGIRIDRTDSEGNTPLFLAVEEDREDIAITLAARGADPEIRNKDDKRAVDVVHTSSLLTKLRNAVQRSQNSVECN